MSAVPEDEFPEGYPEVLEDLAAKLAALLVDEAGLEVAQARAIGFRAAEYMRLSWGGANLYLSKGRSYVCGIRDRELFEKFNGRNTLELAREYNLTETRVYQIVKAMRAEQLKARQGCLL